MINETKKYFDENGYVVIQNFVKPEMTSLLYEYMKNIRRIYEKYMKNI